MWYCVRRKIKALRLQNGLTQLALAERLGVSTGTVSYWESGERDIPTEALPGLSVALGFDLVTKWAAPVLHFPGDNRRPLMPPYPVKGSIADLASLRYARPEVPPIVLSEMEAAYPRDTKHELVAAFKVLGAGGQLCFTSLDVLGCPLLVMVSALDRTNSLRHIRHALRWKDMILIPQVTLASTVQSRTPRVDWLVVCNKRWVYVELNGGRHDPELDDVRNTGLNLLELRYSNRGVLSGDFIRWLERDVHRLVGLPDFTE